MSKRSIILMVVLAVFVAAIAAVVYFTVDFDNAPKDTKVTAVHDDDYSDLPKDPGYSESYMKNPEGVNLSVVLKMRVDYYDKIISDLSDPSEHSLSDIYIRRYFGNYSGCEVAYMGSRLDYNAAERPVEVAGYKVVFPSGEEVWVYKNGKFYTLVEGYELGKITKGDVYEIGKKVSINQFEKNYPKPLED